MRILEFCLSAPVVCQVMAAFTFLVVLLRTMAIVAFPVVLACRSTLNWPSSQYLRQQRQSVQQRRWMAGPASGSLSHQHQEQQSTSAVAQNTPWLLVLLVLLPAQQHQSW
jgi:hypothetical protein